LSKAPEVKELLCGYSSSWLAFALEQKGRGCDPRAQPGVLMGGGRRVPGGPGPGSAPRHGARVPPVPSLNPLGVWVLPGFCQQQRRQLVVQNFCFSTSKFSSRQLIMNSQERKSCSRCTWRFSSSASLHLEGQGDYFMFSVL